MPRSPDGTYSLPTGTLVSTGETLLVSQHNPAMQDIAQAVGASLDRDGLGGMRAALDMGGYAIQNLTPGVNPTDAATVSQLGGSAGVPVGTIVDFAGSVIPSGWLVCGGQSVSRTEYATLFAVIGTAYGSISGTTFNLPDCRGRVAAGRDFDSGGLAGRLTTLSPNGTTLGAQGGAQSVVLTQAQLAAHTHTGSTSSAGAHTHSVGVVFNDHNTPNTGGEVGLATEAGQTGSAGAHTHTMNLDSTGSNEAHPNVQPTILFNKLIKAS